jgi:L-asparagine transporter-like permease
VTLLESSAHIVRGRGSCVVSSKIPAQLTGRVSLSNNNRASSVMMETNFDNISLTAIQISGVIVVLLIVFNEIRKGLEKSIVGAIRTYRKLRDEWRKKR